MTATSVHEVENKVEARGQSGYGHRRHVRREAQTIVVRERLSVAGRIPDPGRCLAAEVRIFLSRDLAERRLDVEARNAEKRKDDARS